MKRLLICLALLATVPANAQGVTPGAATPTVQPGSPVNVPATAGADPGDMNASCPVGLAVTGVRLTLGTNCSGTCGQGRSVLEFGITCGRIQN